MTRQRCWAAWNMRTIGSLLHQPVRQSGWARRAAVHELAACRADCLEHSCHEPSLSLLCMLLSVGLANHRSTEGAELLILPDMETRNEIQKDAQRLWSSIVIEV